MEDVPVMQDENAGYHYIVIPSYSDSDYIAMLDSRNEEMQYNAICYLNENTRTNNDIINTDSLKGTKAYDSTLGIYKKIYPLMNSNKFLGEQCRHQVLPEIHVSAGKIYK